MIGQYKISGNIFILLTETAELPKFLANNTLPLKAPVIPAMVVNKVGIPPAADINSTAAAAASIQKLIKSLLKEVPHSF